jgi:hypothetical protein
LLSILNWQSLLGLLGQMGITVAIAGIVAWGGFKFMGKKWIEARFAEDLERFRHQQIAEIERLKFRITTLVDRTTKLHQHEYEVLPKIWELLGIAFTEVRGFSSPLQSYPDVSVMGGPQFLSFLERSQLIQWQQDELIELPARERNAAYQAMVFRHQFQAAWTAHSDFHNYLISKGIFIQPELKEKLRTMSDRLYDALVERKSAREDRDEGEPPRRGRYAASTLVREDGPSLLTAIENDIQVRLWDTSRLD